MIFRALALAAVLSLSAFAADAQDIDPAQQGAASSSSAESAGMDIDQIMNEMADEAIQCVAVVDAEGPKMPARAGQFAELRTNALFQYQMFTDATDADVAALLPDLIKTYNSQVAGGTVKPSERIATCVAGYSE